MRSIVFLLLVVLPASAQQYAATTLSRHILTNDGVISLAKAGFDELFIVERIKTSRTRFDTTVPGLIAMKEAGVSEDLIRIMAQEDRLRNPTPPELGPSTTGLTMSAAPVGNSPPGTNQTSTAPAPQVTVEKKWWVFRWVRVSP
jgi:hypothetical protein